MNFKQILDIAKEEVLRLENEFAGQIPVNIIFTNMRDKNIGDIDIKVALQMLERKNYIKINNEYIRLTTKNEIGENMQVQKENKFQAQDSRKESKRVQLNCTPEQKAFARLVKARKSDIFDAKKIFIHRGAEVVFGGCGDKAFKYKMAISGYSDKEPVELKEFWLDWDDSALYDEGGLADQIKELLGETTLQPVLTPAIQAQVGGK